MDNKADPRNGPQPRGHDRVDVPRSSGSSASQRRRDEMPSGRTMGLSSARDPAAASFDVDEEAAGETSSSTAVERERAQLHQQPAAAAASLDTQTSSRGQALMATVVVLLLVLGAAALWFVMR